MIALAPTTSAAVGRTNGDASPGTACEKPKQAQTAAVSANEARERERVIDEVLDLLATAIWTAITVDNDDYCHVPSGNQPKAYGR